MKTALRICLMFCVMLSQTISAQLAFTSPSFGGQYFFTNYTVEDGLSNTAVMCMVKDADGFLWVGTMAGLNRFNGYDFTIYKSLASDSATLPSNIIHHLMVDHSGKLWIATSSGICLYEKKQNRFKRLYYLTLEGKKVYSAEYSKLFQDSENNIWATTIGAGLLKYNPQCDCFEQKFSPGYGQSKNLMSSVIEDADGKLWISSYKHLFQFNPADNSFREFENRLPREDNITIQAMEIFQDSFDKNFLWLGTWGDGLVHFDKRSGEFVSYKLTSHASRNLDNIVFDIHQHGKNILWLATNRGIVVFDEQKKSFDGFACDSLSKKAVVNTQIHAIYTDDEGILWIGAVNGLANIHPAKQNFISQPLWVNAPLPKFYYEEQTDKIYGIRYYSNRSLHIYDRRTGTQTVHPIPDADALGAEPFSILKDDDGLIWIGTTKGIYTFDEKKKKFSLLNVSQELHTPDRSLYARSAYKDSNGNLWFACYAKGLLKIERQNKTLTPYFYDENNKSSFPLTAINKITEGSEKIIYACDDYKGIVKLSSSGKTWEHFNAEEDKHALLKGATDIALDSEDKIWITTKNNGLICIDKNEALTAFVRDDFGHLVDEQQCVVADASGKIWLAASTGVFRFDPAAKSFTLFTLQDGFPAQTLSDAFYPLSNGNIAFVFTKGIYSFDPLRVAKTGNELRVHLISFSVNGKISPVNDFIDNLDTVKLIHTENNLTIEFAATNFLNASATTYSYMLDGIDKIWSSPTRTRMVNFSQLSPGDYWLRIKAGENSPEKKLFIQIVPAWWQTKWFLWLVIFSIIGIIFFGIRYYLSFRYRQKIAVFERQREIENIRMRISRDIHDEIGSGLTKIKLMSRNLTRASADTKTMKETSVKISSASDELIQNLSEIVWTVNPTNDSLENVFAFTRNYLSKLFEENPEVNLTLDFPEPAKIPPGISINPEVKRNLLLILKEAMTNIFKHAYASEVKIALQADKSKIEMSIKDNGKGISDESQNGFGNGLKNMRKRAESINAQFNIESLNEGGTAIHVLISLGKS